MKKLFLVGMMIFGLSMGPVVHAQGVYPDVPKATGEPHPEGNEFMRINHPDLLRHDRDLTVRDGDRDVDYSLAGCVACHAVNGPDAKPVTSESSEYFCRVCHDYAAVKIDCFQCHNSLPPDLGEASLMFDRPEQSLDVLLTYLEGLSR